MATIKAVKSAAPISNAITYVMKKEKTDMTLLSGKDCTPLTCANEMQCTKNLWRKNGGRTYMHFVISFHPDEKISPHEAHKLAKKLVGTTREFDGYEILIATHKDREHVHTHLIVNSVNYRTGRKFQFSRQNLKDLKSRNDHICRRHGLSITRKGFTFHGEKRTAVTAYDKETYRHLIAAETGTKDSFIRTIALMIADARCEVENKEAFIHFLEKKGIAVRWEEERKYITFTDTARELAGEKKCSIRDKKLSDIYGILIDKDSLLSDFEKNVRENDRQKLDRFEHMVQEILEKESSSSGSKLQLLQKLNELNRLRPKKPKQSRQKEAER